MSVEELQSALKNILIYIHTDSLNASEIAVANKLLKGCKTLLILIKPASIMIQ